MCKRIYEDLRWAKIVTGRRYATSWQGVVWGGQNEYFLCSASVKEQVVVEAPSRPGLSPCVQGDVFGSGASYIEAGPAIRIHAEHTGLNPGFHAKCRVIILKVRNPVQVA